MSATTTANSSIATLERILGAQLEEYQKLLACIERKRQAIRAATIAGVASICCEEDAIMRRLIHLEKQRTAVVARIGKSNEPLPLGKIAALAGPPHDSRLIALAAQLREAIERVNRESSIIRAAADALARHLSGIAQVVHSTLSNARTYSQGGRIAFAVLPPSAVDIKS